MGRIDGGKRVSALNCRARVEIGATRSAPGTIDALVSSYVNGVAFKNLAPETQKSRRGILERFRHKHGGKRMTTLQREHVQKNDQRQSRNTIGGSEFSQSAAPTDGVRG